MNEKAIEAAAKAAFNAARAWAGEDDPPSFADGEIRECYTDMVRAAIGAYTSALPPLRAREEIARGEAHERLRTAYQDMEARCAAYQAAAKIDLARLDEDRRELALWAACEAGRWLDQRAGDGPNSEFGLKLEKIAGILSLPAGQEWRDTSVLQDDLRDMLRALGLPDGARPQSPHEIFRECIEAVKVLKPQSSAEYHQKRGAAWDIVDEALIAYREFMLDDDYDAITALKKICDRMEERRALYSLSRTAGQEWRDGSPRNAFLVNEIIEKASLMTTGKVGYLGHIIKCAETLKERLPAPPVAEPIVAEKSEMKS